jgi:hypothetical protein
MSGVGEKRLDEGAGTQDVAISARSEKLLQTTRKLPDEASQNTRNL